MNEILKENLVERSRVALIEFQHAKEKFRAILTVFVDKIRSGQIRTLDADLKNDRVNEDNDSCQIEVERFYKDFIEVSVRGNFLARPRRKDNIICLSYCVSQEMRLCIHVQLMDEKIGLSSMHFSLKVLYFTFEITGSDGNVCQAVKIDKKIFEQAPSHA